MNGKKAKYLRKLTKLTNQNLPEATVYNEGQKNKTQWFQMGEGGKMELKTFEYTGTVTLGVCLRKAYKAIKNGYKNVHQLRTSV